MELPEPLWRWWEKTTAIAPVAFFVGGFVLDVLALGRRVDVHDLYWLGLYFLLAMLLLSLLVRYRATNNGEADPDYGEMASEGNEPGPLSRLYRLGHEGLFFALQFVWGGLFSALLVLYIKSSGHFAAFAFAALLACLLIGNEHAKRLYRSSISIQWAIFAWCLMLWLNIVLPHWLHSLHAAMTALAIATAVLVVLGWRYLLKTLWPHWPASAYGRWFGPPVAAMLLTLLHLIDAIPPVPLVRKHMVIAQALDWRLPQTTVGVETRPWWQLNDQLTNRQHIVSGTRLYFVSSVFAPESLVTSLSHRWQRQDAQGHWLDVVKTNFAMVGGRDGGFRGYSYKSDPSPGRWRVRIESASGRTLDQLAFTVDKVGSPVVLAWQVFE